MEVWLYLTLKLVIPLLLITWLLGLLVMVYPLLVPPFECDLIRSGEFLLFELDLPGDVSLR